jgi:hypothetical protein
MPSSAIRELETILIPFVFIASRLTTLVTALLAVWCLLSQIQILSEFPIQTGPLSNWIDWTMVSIAVSLSGRACSTLRPAIKHMRDAGIRAVHWALAGSDLAPAGIVDANWLHLRRRFLRR